MVLGRERILNEIRERNLIEGYSEDCVEPAGYDLRVGEFFRIVGGGEMLRDSKKTPDVERIVAERIELKPNEYILIRTLEKVNMPSDIAGFVFNKSSVFRCGCTTVNAFVDPGFSGKLTFGLKNISELKFTLEKGAKITQIVFQETEGAGVYDGKYQGGKVV